jgi:ATP-binding protein involved in chromosome partitioning
MLGLRRRAKAKSVTVFAPKGRAGARIEAVTRHGVQIASAAFLIGEGQGLAVQAPIAQLLVLRLIASTEWDEPDCLVVDLPPGTADVQQLVLGLAGRPLLALVVVTPQLVAHRDAHRMLHELDRGKITVLGGVENMAGQLCPNCGELTALFPPAPAEDTIWTRIPKLASVPFSSAAAADADNGQPVMITERVPEQVAAYQRVARTVQAAISGLN